MVDETQIERAVLARRDTIDISHDWYTPSGRKRDQPMYYAEVRNDYLQKYRKLKDSDHDALVARAKDQMRTWNQQEIRERVREAKKNAQERAESRCEALSREARARIHSIETLLTSTLKSHAIDWNAEEDHSPPPDFARKHPRPAQPQIAPFEPTPKGSWEWLFASKRQRREEEDARRKQEHDQTVARLTAEYEAAVKRWQQLRDEARAVHERQQRRYNEGIRKLRANFEAGALEAREQYFEEVFNRSEYPDAFPVDRSLTFFSTKPNSVVVDLGLPDFDDFPEVGDFKFIKSKSEARPVNLKVNERKDLYDSAVKQAVLRTVHEVFSADNPHTIRQVVVNGWVSYVDSATGHDAKACLIAASIQRPDYEAVNLRRVNAGDCLDGLGTQTKGRMHLRKPVDPMTIVDDTNDGPPEPTGTSTVVLDEHSEANVVEVSMETRRSWEMDGKPVPAEHESLLTALEQLGWRTNVTALAESLGKNPAAMFRQLAAAQRFFKANLTFDRQDGLVEADAAAFD